MRDIDPKMVGRVTGEIICKALAGDELTSNESAILGSFQKLYDVTFSGVPINDIPKGGIFTERFGKKK